MANPTRHPVDQDARQKLRAIIERLSLRRDRVFKLASGRESNYFFDLKPTLLDPEGINLIADAVVREAAALGAQCIGGRAMGAVPIVIAAVLKSASTDQPLRGFWVRKEVKDHGAQSKADGHIVPGSRVAVVEDVTTTGGTVQKVIELVREMGAKPIGVAAIADRSGGKVTFDVPFYSLLKLNLWTYEPDFCPLCKAGTVAEKPGSSKK